MMIHSRKFISAKPGPHVLMLGAIHGNEVCGPRALHKLIEEFDSGKRQLLKGSCTIVPVCNQKAYEQNKRYIDENLNRIFHPHDALTSHERALAQQLAPLVHDCDYMIDIHSMQSEGEPFVFLNYETIASEQLCHALGLKWILTGWPELYKNHPDHLSCCTQTYADKWGKPNALVECGQNGDPKADVVAYDVTLRSLRHLGLLDVAIDLPAVKPQLLKLTQVFFRKSEADKFAKVWKNFEAIKKNEILAYRNGKIDESICAPHDGVIVFPSPISAIGTEWFYTAQYL